MPKMVPRTPANSTVFASVDVNSIIATGATEFMHPFDNDTSSATESAHQVESDHTCTVVAVYVYVSANASTTDGSLLLRIAGSTSASSPIGQGATGWFKLTAGVALPDDTLWCIGVTAGATGGITVTRKMVELTN